MPPWLLYFIMWITLSYGCNVEVQKPFHPMYVQVGYEMDLTCLATGCVGSHRVILQWWRQTQRTVWNESKIVPTVPSGWITRHLQEEPSGYTEATLLKKKLELSDRGWYICKDSENINSYSIWVTTLKILHTADIRLVQPGSDLTLVCNITGLDSNLPHIEYVWYLGQLEVVDIEDRFTLGDSSNGHMSLTLHKPRKNDGGMYRCAFILGTNLGPVTFSEKISVNTEGLVASASRTMVPLTVLVVLLRAAVIAFCPRNNQGL